MRARRTVLAAMAAVTAATAAGCGAAGTGPGPASKGPSRAAPEPARLVSYTDCAQMLGQLQGQALGEVGPYGLTGTGVAVPTWSGTIAARVSSLPAVAAPAAAEAAGTAGGAAQSDAGTAGSGAPGGFSTTNVQEQGVDEPDIAKTDGSLLVTLRQSGDTLEVAGVGGSPALLGSISLPLVQGTGLFLVGHDAVVLGSARQQSMPKPAGGALAPGPSGAAVSNGPVGAPAIAVGPSGTEVVVVDLSDPGHPQIARSFDIDGTFVDARLLGGTIEVVVASSPHLAFFSPADGSPTATAAAAAANRNVVLSAGPAAWLPSVTSQPTGTTTVAPCASAMHVTSATSPSGLGTVGIVPIDPNSDQPGTEVTVVGDATTVYASTKTLYVATSFAPVGTSPVGTSPVGTSPVGTSSTEAADTTAIDAFDLSDPAAPRYMGSGQVPGTLIGQYALSEYQGVLRVATTVGSATPPPGEGTAPSTPSDNRVTVLSVQSGALVPIGAVTGLGAGEKIYAVRFVGALAYVVTFRQTDPFYVVDLSDPAAPHLAGQLPLTGYSSFLQPLGNNLVLGVGQAVDDNLRTSGLQISLFDVSDPADPKLVSKEVLAGASSVAQEDPHALLYWAPTGTLVLPVTQWQPQPSPVEGVGSSVSPTTDGFSGAIVWKLSGSTLAQTGRISQPEPVSTEPSPAPGTTSGAVTVDPMMPVVAPSIERALVVGDKLFTVSDAGILQSDLSTLAQGAWMAYP